MTEDTKLPTPAEPEDHIDDEEYARSILAAWGKPIPKIWDAEELKFFHPITHKPEIQALARGLTIEEALNYYGLIPGVLPEYDALYFVSTYLQGRMKAKSDAVQALFANMTAGSGNGGVQASLAYLRRFASTFQGEDGGATDQIRAIKIEVVE